MRWILMCSVGLAACGDDGLQPVDDRRPDSLDPAAPQGPTPGPGLGGAVPSDIDTVEQACEGPRSERSLTVRFEDPRAPCAWAQDGNVNMIDGFITARREQEHTLDLPPGAVICDVDFEFERQDFWYDDHFLINLNDVTLTASFDFSRWLEHNGLWRYRWRDIRGLQWHSLEQPLDTTYCPGSDTGLSRCSFPKTEADGTIELELSDSIIRAIMALDLEREEHTMSFVTTGDDNPATDCQHDPIQLILNVAYAE